MRVRPELTLLLVALLVPAFAACEGERWWKALGVHSFEEIDAAEAREWIGRDEVIVVSVSEKPQTVSGTPGVHPLAPGAPIPPELAETAARLLVLADSEEVARRTAARLVRAGAPRVAVVRGGSTAWQQAEAASGDAGPRRF